MVAIELTPGRIAAPERWPVHPPPERVQAPLEVAVISTNALVNWAVEQSLEAEARLFRCRVISSADLDARRLPIRTDVALVAPQSWEELQQWLPCLQSRSACPRWLLAADPRVAGMFLSTLELHGCDLVGPAFSRQQLYGALLALADHHTPCLSRRMLAHFDRSTLALSRGRLARRLSPAELQCGCAVSLGLSNRRIAEVVHVSEATVKSHVHNLLQKLQMTNRGELGVFVHRVLSEPITV
jgi:ATP/maltotriose-dependent transcriptional regulator MalT